MSESAGRPTPGYRYIVQQGDTCRSIAQQAYGDENSWKNVFMANALVIGDNPNRLVVGTELYILANPEKLLRYQATQCCKVTSDAGLMGRAAPTTKSNVIASFPQNTTLCFSEVVEGEQVNNVWCWGYASLGGGLTFYFWMGGTNWGGTC